MTRAHKRAALAACTFLTSCGIAGGVSMAAEPLTGAPKSAEVKLDSHLEIPPMAYALDCTGLSSCTSEGTMQLAVTSTVAAAYNPAAEATRGAARMPYTLVEGSVRRSLDCGSAGEYVSSAEPTGSREGRLAVTGITSVPETNDIAVELNPGGETGTQYPGEVTRRFDGGCGAPPHHDTRQEAQWYYNFFWAHEGTSPSSGSELVFDDLSWDAAAGAFVQDFDRWVDVLFGFSTYPVYERTRLEVRPEFCEGSINEILGSEAAGKSLGLEGMRFYEGQIVTLPKDARVELEDGSLLDMKKGGSFRVNACDATETVLGVPKGVKKMYFKILKLLSGTERKFEVRTDRAVAGVRGTKFGLSYDKRKRLTKVWVDEGAVSLKAINGAKGKILIKPGQIGVQQGKKKPKLIRR